jgi:hypothetical protein
MAPRASVLFVVCRLLLLPPAIDEGVDHRDQGRSADNATDLIVALEHHQQRCAHQDYAHEDAGEDAEPVHRRTSSPACFAASVRTRRCS